MTLLHFKFAYEVPYKIVESNCSQSQNYPDFYNLDVLPLDFLPLLTFDKFENIKFWVTQGRWNEHICFQIQNKDAYTPTDSKCIPEGVMIHEPGFSFLFDFGTNSSKNEVSSASFYINQIGYMFGEFSYPSSQDHLLYYGNPGVQSLCDDNLAQFKAHLKSTCESSGISTLLDASMLHQFPQPKTRTSFSEYKSIQFELINESSEFSTADGHPQGLMRLQLTFDSVVTHKKQNNKVYIKDLLGNSGESFKSCFNAKSSTIRILEKHGFKDLLRSEAGITYNLNMILGWIDLADQRNFEREELAIKRYVNDRYFGKEVDLTLMITNQGNRTVELAINEFIPHYLKFYSAGSKLSIYKNTNENRKVIKEILTPAFAKNESIIWEMRKQNNGVTVCIGIFNGVSIGNILLEPDQDMVLNLKMKKRLIGAEKMPADVSMDANVPSLPIIYKEAGASNQKNNYKIAYSPAWLVTLLEPDFSMAFNLNAMMFGVFGTVVHYLYSVTVELGNMI